MNSLSNTGILRRICAWGVALCVALTEVRGQNTLRAIDSVAVQEQDGAYLGRIQSISIGPRSHVFISELTDGRIFQVAPNGKIVGTFGRKGNGPGEFTSPGSMAFIGDSIFVLDRGQQRISVFDLSTRKFRRSFNVSLGGFADITSAGKELLALVIDPKTLAPVTVISTSGVTVRTEGVLPEILHKNPMLAQVAFQVPVAINGQDTWGASEFSQSLFRWQRGATVALEELKLPATRRRGVNPELYLQMIQDPSRGAELVYNHSVPRTLAFVAPDVLALVTFDPKFEKGIFTGPHHLTLANVRSKKVCPDVLLPIPFDPLPKVAISGDTLFVVKQGVNSSDDVVTSILRYRIDARPCMAG